MAASPSTGMVTLRLRSGKTISWPKTVAGKIEEGLYKVRMIEHFAEEADRDIQALQEEAQRLAAAFQSGLRLDECILDLEDMRKARQVYRAGPPLSEAERRHLTEIRDLSASAVARYEALVGAVPAYDRVITMFSDAIPFDLPETLSNPSHRKPAADKEG